jgi:acyl-CoA dehydrogenase
VIVAAGAAYRKGRLPRSRERLAQLTIVTLLLEQAEIELQRGVEGTGKRKWLIALLYKYYIPKRGEYVTLEALEIRGGNGYVEDWPNARLLRDCIVKVIWEGSSNVIVLDVARAMQREGAASALSNMLLHRLRAVQHPVVALAAQQAQSLIHELMARLQELTEAGGEQSLLPLRGLVERLAQLTIYTLLLEQAEAELSRGHAGTGQRKWLVAHLFLRRHIQPHADGWAASDVTRARGYFSLLVVWRMCLVEI